MKLPPMPLGFVFLLAVASCAQQEANAPASGTWVGTITTEGNVTTVVNESGSVWRGAARLVEEASIGVEAGADEYMFSSVLSVFGTDEHIYVVDWEARLVRRYDHDGVYVDTIGARGQGPGEFSGAEGMAWNGASTIYVTNATYFRWRGRPQNSHGSSLLSVHRSLQAGPLKAVVSHHREPDSKAFQAVDADFLEKSSDNTLSVLAHRSRGREDGDDPD